MMRKFFIGFLAVLLCSCANRGVGPQGGPRDSIPPHVVSIIPENGSTQFNAKRIELLFDEYLQLDNVADNVVLSPPTKQIPEVKVVGKKVFVTFQDSLKDSTTYTLEFGNAICDFTEKVPLRGFTYCFSTGDVIDSLEVSGRVVNSEDLNPISGLVVGLHSHFQDSAFSTRQFDNITKTDTGGWFVIHNVHEGRYRVYALQDISRDYIYQPGEGLAFNDSIWQTTIDIRTINDTIWKDSVIVDSTLTDSLRAIMMDSVLTDTIRVVDSIVNRTEITKGPKDVTLWFFKEAKVRKYFQRAYREEQHLLRFVWVGAQDERPTFRALPPSAIDKSFSDDSYIDWMPYTRWNYNKTNDTIQAWLADSIVIQQDSLFVEVTYMKTDSVYKLVPQTDTLRCIYRAPRLTEKMAETKARQARNRKTEIKCNASGKFAINKAVELTMSMPLDTLIKDSITLWRKLDTTYQQLDFDIRPLDSASIRYEIVYNWKSEPYEIRVDSAAVRDIYGKVNNKMKFQFSVRSKEEYSTLLLSLPNFDSRMVVQLLNDKGDPVITKRATLKNQSNDLEEEKVGQVLFENVEPKSYYMRLFIDENEDGEWTTGDWAKKKQPEPVYYYTKNLTFKANWDFEEEWDYKAVPQLKAKPKALIKDVGGAKK